MSDAEKTVPVLGKCYRFKEDGSIDRVTQIDDRLVHMLSVQYDDGTDASRNPIPYAWEIDRFDSMYVPCVDPKACYGQIVAVDVAEPGDTDRTAIVVFSPRAALESALHDIGANPSRVGLTHAKILRDEIIALRSKCAEHVNEERKTLDVCIKLRRENDNLRRAASFDDALIRSLTAVLNHATVTIFDLRVKLHVLRSVFGV